MTAAVVVIRARWLFQTRLSFEHQQELLLPQGSLKMPLEQHLRLESLHAVVVLRTMNISMYRSRETTYVDTTMA